MLMSDFPAAVDVLIGLSVCLLALSPFLCCGIIILRAFRFAR